MTDVVTDVLGAAPEPDVLALAGIVDGNPFLLVDLLEKLKSEGVFQIADGHARMVSARLPRAQAVTQERLAELSAPTRHLLQGAGILGRSFSVKDLAEMLGESTSGLLPMLEEAMSAGIVEPAGMSSPSGTTCCGRRWSRPSPPRYAGPCTTTRERCCSNAAGRPFPPPRTSSTAPAAVMRPRCSDWTRRRGRCCAPHRRPPPTSPCGRWNSATPPTPTGSVAPPRRSTP